MKNRWHRISNFLKRRTFCALVLFLAWFCLAQSPAWAGPDDSNACSTNAASRQLDFWLGQWSVTYPGAPSASSSSVSLQLGKCVIMENWSGKTHEGMNVFAYSADDKQWHGLFADNEGRVHVFEGKVADGAAEFVGPSQDANGKTELNRIQVKRLSKDRVEQTWEKSADNGTSWTTVFRGEYSRKNTGIATGKPGK
jgi:hypothetical protein